MFLGNNEISSLDVLKRINSKELKELYLFNNKIYNIKALDNNQKLEKLEILSLYDNRIDKKINKSLISKLKNKIRVVYI